MAEIRQDGLTNVYTGMGIQGRDPSLGFGFTQNLRLTQEEQAWFNDAYGLCRKITETIPAKMGYRWCELTLNEGSQDVLTKIQDYLNKVEVYTQDPEPSLGVQSAFISAQTAANLTGNAAIIIFADDGQDLDKPINLKTLKKIEKLQVLDRWQITPNATKFPIDEYYIGGYGFGIDFKTTRIHRDRVIWFRGSELSQYSLRSNQWCDQSELDPLIHAIRLFLSGIEGMGRMLSNWDIRVHSMSGLFEKLLDGGSETEIAIAKRLMTNDMGASMFRSMAVDKDTESLSYLTHQAGGYSDLVGQLKTYLVSSTRFPPSILFGEFASGLGAANQDTESKRVWNETCEVEIFRKKWTDKLLRLLNVAQSAKTGPTNGKVIEGIGVRWKPPYTPTENEQAELELQKAQLVSTYGSFDPAFVPMALQSMYGSNEFNPNITLPDGYAEYLEASMGNTIDQALNPPEEMPMEEAPIEGEEAPVEEVPTEEVTDSSDQLEIPFHEDGIPDKYRHISFAVPLNVQKSAKKGLELRKKHGRGGLTTQEAGEQGIGSGVARASDLAAGRVSPETVRRMKAYFDRHRSDKKAKDWNNTKKPSNGRIAWELWGGEPGRAWAKRIVNQMDIADRRAGE